MDSKMAPGDSKSETIDSSVEIATSRRGFLGKGALVGLAGAGAVLGLAGCKDDVAAANAAAPAKGTAGDASHVAPGQLDIYYAFISDDGAGFDPAQLDSQGEGHVGIHIMRERAHRIDAALAVTSAPGSGTSVTLTLPQAQRRAA